MTTSGDSGRKGNVEDASRLGRRTAGLIRGGETGALGGHGADWRQLSEGRSRVEAAKGEAGRRNAALHPSLAAVAAGHGPGRHRPHHSQREEPQEEPGEAATTHTNPL